MRLFWVVAFALLLTASAHADITVTNFFNNTAAGSGDFNRIAVFNSDNVQTDFHDSTILQWPVGTNNYYRYSEQYGCGSFAFVDTGLPSNPWCGIHVWYSTDLGADGGPGWQHLGLLFDPTSYQTRCNPGDLAGLGCWSFTMVHNAANNNFVAMMHDGTGVAKPAVFVCSPSGSGPPVPGNANCVEQARSTFSGNGGCTTTNVDTIHIFVDDDASGYAAYTCGGNFKLFIDKLKADYTDWNGVNSVAPAALLGMEGESIFRKGATYYLIYQPTCAYCDGSAVSYATASSPLGTWTTQGTIESTACHGQNEGTFKATIGGTDYYFFQSDLWTNQGGSFNNQGLAMEMIEPFTFTGSAINTLTCSTATSWTLVNGSISPGSARPAQPAALTDESSVFSPYCDINSSNNMLQTFVAPFTRTGFYIRLVTSQNLNACLNNTGPCSPINGNLIVDIVTLDGSNNPVSVLGSATILPSDIAFRLTPQVLRFNAGITSGTSYGLRLRGTNTIGCWAWLFNDNLPYAAGLTRNSTNGGSTWATQTNRSLRFAILDAAALPFGGVPH